MVSCIISNEEEIAASFDKLMEKASSADEALEAAIKARVNRELALLLEEAEIVLRADKEGNLIVTFETKEDEEESRSPIVASVAAVELFDEAIGYYRDDGDDDAANNRTFEALKRFKPYVREWLVDLGESDQD